MFSAKRTDCHFLHCAKSNQKAHARTCKKLPVASFCASETAETGRIANGREQGDHVSRRQSGKGFNFVCAKLLFGWADSRFAEPRSFPVRETVLFFSLVRKERGVPQRFANLWTPGTIQISARFKIFAKMTGHHHVTGRAGYCKVSGYRR